MRSIENYSFVAVHQDAMFQMPAHRAREHYTLHVPPLFFQIREIVAVRNSGHVLLDDRPLVQRRGYVVAGCADEFHAALMRRLRSTPPSTIAGFGVTTTDLLPRTDALIFTGGGADTTARVVVRPSGTEPKVKFYIEVTAGDRGRADALRDGLAAAVRGW